MTVIPPKAVDTFFTGAKRSTRKGRGMPHLMPFDALEELSIHFEEGATVGGYGARNWEKGIPYSAYIDSTFRHMKAITEGDTSESHFRALAWNTLCLLATHIRVERGELSPELDDRRTPAKFAAVDAAHAAVDINELQFNFTPQPPIQFDQCDTPRRNGLGYTNGY